MPTLERAASALFVCPAKQDAAQFTNYHPSFLSLSFTLHWALSRPMPRIRLRSAICDSSGVIDQAATLWATTSCRDPEGAVKMPLRKSAGTSLSVACICNDRKEPCNYVTLVLPHCGRWSSLRAETAYPQSITALLSGKTPGLRS